MYMPTIRIQFMEGRLKKPSHFLIQTNPVMTKRYVPGFIFFKNELQTLIFVSKKPLSSIIEFR